MPANPLILQVVERFETVLNSIQAGTNYFYTPHKVSQPPYKYENAKYGNIYLIFIGEEPGSVEITGRENYDATFTITVIGVVFDRSNLTTRIIKSWRDVVYAIDQDSKSPDAGTLGKMSVQIRVDETYEAFYYDDYEGFADFRQKFRCQITGDLGVL